MVQRHVALLQRGVVAIAPECSNKLGSVGLWFGVGGAIGVNATNILKSDRFYL
ncbi:MAG: hypothetical protein MUF49_29900 [Oculatellaceae cyanobacterium Prado106]|nr:hypothetical protein [Oculatellaceae cyanobacterium Prado106]